MSRLIDADTLKEAITKATYNFEQIPIRVDKVQEIVDNAPTVECEILTKEAYSDLCLRASREKPQGKWIKVAIVENYCWHYECDQCHERPLMDRFADYEEVLSDYCPNCGARMERG